MGKTENFDKQAAVILNGGGVQYDPAEAAVSIDDLIEALEDAKSEGAEFVLMSSGNYRGAKWASVGSSWSWADDEG